MLAATLTLQNLPNDIILVIFTHYVGFAALYRCYQTCRFWRACLLLPNARIWRDILMSQFPAGASPPPLLPHETWLDLCLLYDKWSDWGEGCNTATSDNLNYLNNTSERWRKPRSPNKSCQIHRETDVVMPSLTPEIVPLDQSLSANAVVERHIVLTSSTKYKCLNPFFNNQQPQSSSLVRESQNVTLVRTDLYPTVSKGGMEIWNTARHQPVITYNANLNGNAKVSICGHTVLLRNSGSPNLVCFWVFPPNLDKQERQSPVEVVIPDQYFQKLRKEVSNWQYVLHNEQFLCFVSSLDSDQNDRHIRLYRIPEYGEAMKNLLPSDNVTNADDSCSYSHYVNNPKWHQKRTLARLIATYPLLDIPSDIAFITRTHLISYNSIGTVVHRLSDLRVVGSQRRPSEDWHGWPDGFWTTDDGSSIVYLNKVERGRRGIFLYDFVNGFRVWKRDGDERGVWVYVRERDGAGGKGEGGVWRSRMLWKSLEE